MSSRRAARRCRHLWCHSSRLRRGSAEALAYDRGRRRGDVGSCSHCGCRPWGNRHHVVSIAVPCRLTRMGGLSPARGCSGCIRDLPWGLSLAPARLPSFSPLRSRSLISAPSEAGSLAARSVDGSAVRSREPCARPPPGADVVPLLGKASRGTPFASSYVAVPARRAVADPSTVTTRCSRRRSRLS